MPDDLQTRGRINSKNLKFRNCLIPFHPERLERSLRVAFLGGENSILRWNLFFRKNNPKLP